MELPQQPSCLQDLLAVVPTPINDAGSTVGLAPHNGRTGELWKGGPARGLSLMPHLGQSSPCKFHEFTMRILLLSA